jgi:hypothetical protein
VRCEGAERERGREGGREGVAAAAPSRPFVTPSARSLRGPAVPGMCDAHPGTRRHGTGPSLDAAAGGISESPKGTCGLWISRYSDLWRYGIVAVSNELL